MNTLRTTRDVSASRFVGSAGAQRARSPSGTFHIDQDLRTRLTAAEERAKAAEAENAVLRAELEIQAKTPAAKR